MSIEKLGHYHYFLFNFVDKKALERAILKTLAYFDIFSQPLTADELFGFLWCPPAVSQEIFLQNLNFLTQIGRIETAGNYFFLSGRSNIVNLRQARTRLIGNKIKIACRAARLLSWVPFLRAIFLCNSVAAGTADENSDIDFLIITAANRVWLVRALANFLLRIVGWRTYGAHLADRICLSFFVSEKKLNFSSLRATEDDIHFAYWLYQTSPLFDMNGLWFQFVNTNQWIRRYLPYYQLRLSNDERVKPTNAAAVWRRMWETMWRGRYGDLLERQAEILGQQKIKVRSMILKQENAGGVMLDKEVIKLHTNDRRLSVKKNWEEKIRLLLD